MSEDLLTVVIVHYNASSFVELSLFALAKLTKNKYKSILKAKPNPEIAEDLSKGIMVMVIPRLPMRRDKLTAPSVCADRWRRQSAGRGYSLGRETQHIKCHRRLQYTSYGALCMI